MSTNTLLEIKDLRIDLCEGSKSWPILKNINLKIKKGQRIGIVGESGSGKSLLCMSLMGLLPRPTFKIKKGSIHYKNQDLLTQNNWQSLRGPELGMIFQEPSLALNPVLSIGYQFREKIQSHFKISKTEALKKAQHALTSVGIPEAARRLKQFPHELSGGMLQRVVIAIVYTLGPSLLIADEPTTALDVTVQAQIMNLLTEHLEQNPEKSLLLISHDLALVSQNCDTIAVLYSGQIQELAKTKNLFANPKHPYTQALLKSLPQNQRRGEKLYSLGGTPPQFKNLSKGCSFYERCEKAIKKCSSEQPPLKQDSEGRQIRCHLYD